MNLNYLSILVATVVEFVIGAVWYMAIFGNLWAKIHGVNKVSKAERAKMMKGMTTLLVVQFFATLITTFVLAIFLAYQPTWNAYAMAAFFWAGFVVPTQISAVLFGGTNPKWIVTKILIMAGGSFVCLEVATLILHLWR